MFSHRPTIFFEAAWLILLAGCSMEQATDRRVIEDVGVRLTLVDPAPTVGGPLRVRLELVNTGTESWIYDAQQVAVNHSLEMTGPDGRPVPYVHGSFQTLGMTRELLPGLTVLLLESLDVAEQYQVSRPGRYRMRFRSSALLIGRKAASSDPAGSSASFWDSLGSVSSNHLDVEVGPGRLPTAGRLADLLLPGLPKNWQLSRSLREADDGVTVGLSRVAVYISDVKTVAIQLRDAPPARTNWIRGTFEGRAAYVLYREDDSGAVSEVLPWLERVLHLSR